MTSGDNHKYFACDEHTGKVDMIVLANNGLSEKLITSLGELHVLKVLDLSDNDNKTNKQMYSYNKFVQLL